MSTKCNDTPAALDGDKDSASRLKQDTQIDREAEIGDERFEWSENDFDFVPAALNTQPLDEDSLELQRTLELSVEPPTDNHCAPVNVDGVLTGYNPYESGQLRKVPKPRPRNLRRLGECLKSRAKVEGETED